MNPKKKNYPILQIDYDDDDALKYLQENDGKIRIEFDDKCPKEFQKYFKHWFENSRRSSIPSIMEKIHDRLYKFPVISGFTGEFKEGNDAPMKIYANKHIKMIHETAFYQTRKGLVYPFLQIKGGISKLSDFDQIYFKLRKSLFPKFPLNSLKASFHYKKLYPNDLKFTFKSSLVGNSIQRINKEQILKQKLKLNYFEGKHSLRFTRIDDFSMNNLNYFYGNLNIDEVKPTTDSSIRLSLNSIWNNNLSLSHNNQSGSFLCTKLSLSLNTSNFKVSEKFDIEHRKILSLPQRNNIILDIHSILNINSDRKSYFGNKLSIPLYGGWEELDFNKVNSQFSIKGIFNNYPILSNFGVSPFMFVNIQNPQKAKITSGLGFRVQYSRVIVDLLFNVYGYSKDKKRNANFEVVLVNE